MTRTEQAHSWALYAVLILVVLTACVAFLLYDDKLSEGSFVGIVSTVVAFFFGKSLPKNGNGSSPPAPSP